MTGASYFTYHAYERARDRYGLDLSRDDFRSIGHACASGEAPCMATNIKGTIHLWTFRGHTLVVLMSPAKDAIISFLPANYFTARAKLKHRQDCHPTTTKQRGRTARNACRSSKGRNADFALIREAMEEA